MPNGNKKIDKRYAKTERKIATAQANSPAKGAKAEKKYGYNISGAKSAGFSADESGHWPSRNPNTGEIFKGRKHPTIGMTKKVERDMGYRVTKKNGTLYSMPKKKAK